MSQKNDLFRAAYDTLRDKKRVLALFDYIENIQHPNDPNPYKSQNLTIANIHQLNDSLKFKLYHTLKTLKSKFK